MEVIHHWRTSRKTPGSITTHWATSRHHLQNREMAEGELFGEFDTAPFEVHVNAGQLHFITNPPPF